MSTRHRRSEERAYRNPYMRQEQDASGLEGNNRQQPRSLEYADTADRHTVSEGELVSTSQAINLTCTLAALSSLFALFLYFNDHRSRAVRRMSVQSMGLTCGYLLAIAAVLTCQAFFGMIPIIGVVVGLILWIDLVALSLGMIYLKIQMMKQGYQGYAYRLPVMGDWLRRFE